MSNSSKRTQISELAKKALAEAIDSGEAEKRWGKAATERFKARTTAKEDSIFYGAPEIIFIIKTEETANEFDYGLASENIMLAAKSLGLATCPIGLSRSLNSSDQARKLLALKDSETIIIAISIGYANENPPEKERNFSVITRLD